MNFNQRLIRYIVGFMVGLVLCFIFFSGRGCSDWLPGARIKEELVSKPVYFSDPAKCEIECYGFRTSEVFYEMETEGDVVFSRSETRSNPRLYFFEMEKSSCLVQFGDTANVVIDFDPGGLSHEPCGCP